MKRAPAWTQSEDDVLRSMLADKHPQTVIAARLGRPRGAVNARVAKLGLQPVKINGAAVHWTAAETDRLRAMLAQGVRRSVIAERLGRPLRAIDDRVARQNLQPQTPEVAALKSIPQMEEPPA